MSKFVVIPARDATPGTEKWLDVNTLSGGRWARRTSRLHEPTCSTRPSAARRSRASSQAPAEVRRLVGAPPALHPDPLQEVEVVATPRPTRRGRRPAPRRAGRRSRGRGCWSARRAAGAAAAGRPAGAGPARPGTVHRPTACPSGGGRRRRSPGTGPARPAPAAGARRAAARTLSSTESRVVEHVEALRQVADRHLRHDPAQQRGLAAAVRPDQADPLGPADHLVVDRARPCARRAPRWRAGRCGSRRRRAPGPRRRRARRGRRRGAARARSRSLPADTCASRLRAFMTILGLRLLAWSVSA